MNWQIQYYFDRRFWMTSGGVDAIGFGVVDDYGNIVRTHLRPFDDAA